MGVRAAVEGLALGMTRSEETAKIYYAALRRCHPRPARAPHGGNMPGPAAAGPGPRRFLFFVPGHAAWDR